LEKRGKSSCKSRECGEGHVSLTQALPLAIAAHLQVMLTEHFTEQVAIAELMSEICFS